MWLASLWSYVHPLLAFLHFLTSVPSADVPDVAGVPIVFGALMWLTITTVGRLLLCVPLVAGVPGVACFPAVAG